MSHPLAGRLRRRLCVAGVVVAMLAACSAPPSGSVRVTATTDTPSTGFRVTVTAPGTKNTTFVLHAGETESVAHVAAGTVTITAAGLCALSGTVSQDHPIVAATLSDTHCDLS